MSNHKTRVSLEILQAARRAGIVLQADNGELSVRYGMDVKIQTEFIDLIKKNKDDLISLLEMQNADKLIANAHIIAPAGELNGQEYFEVAPDPKWWIDLSTYPEFKLNVFGLFTILVDGIFDVDIFVVAVRKLLERHESLRSAFLRDKEDYWLVVNALDRRYEVEILTSDDNVESHDSAERFIKFRDHRFDTVNGPLFLVRVLRRNPTKVLLSIKIHHAIYDGWSMEVLWRDLLRFYDAELTLSQSKLPILNFQYRHYMQKLNGYIKANEYQHRRYWQQHYGCLPQPITIPGTQPPQPVRCCKQKFVSFDNAEKLNIIARANRASLFEVLQASVIYFSHQLTHSNTIIIGYPSSGRDFFDGAFDQIGFYSKMILISVNVLDRDSLDSVVGKVKIANREASDHGAYSLLKHYESLIPPGENISDRYWRMIVELEDNEGYVVDKSENDKPRLFTTRFQQVDEISEINVDWKFIFSVSGDKINLQLIYDQNVFAPQLIDSLVNSYQMGLARI